MRENENNSRDLEMKQTQRHNGIIELVKQQGYVSTEELVEHFLSARMTIRRDLNELAEQNLILRHHGMRRCLPVRLTMPWHDQSHPDRRKERDCPQSGGANPQWLDTVYRYRHHAGSGGARAA